MRAITVEPRAPGSVRLEEIPEPEPVEGSVLVATIAVGVCGTDREIIAGEHGESPSGRSRLVLGHESLGRVLDAPADSGLAAGDLVVGIVRRPDPEPCVNCAVGEWDMCRNGRYTEHGIKALDGFARERFRIDPSGVVPVDRSLVTGAGPIGLLAAMMARQSGLDVTVLDRIEHGPKPALVAALGATYRVGDVAQAALDVDVVVEATGAASVVFEVMQHNARNAIVCLTGVTSPGRRLDLASGLLARRLVLENDVVFGSVNANRRHYERAAAALAAADRDWLQGLITRTVPLAHWQEAYVPATDGIKTVLRFAD